MSITKYGVNIRIDRDLAILLKEMAIKNDMSVRQASKKLAKISKIKLKGGISEDILF